MKDTTAATNPLCEGLGRYLTPEQLRILRQARVGIAGAGGLGSNAALMLARSGVEHLTLVDHDVVDASNLNRQQYWPRHVGRSKVDALHACTTTTQNWRLLGAMWSMLLREG